LIEPANSTNCVLGKVGDHGLVRTRTGWPRIKDLQYPRANSLPWHGPVSSAKSLGAPGRQSLIAGVRGTSGTGHHEADDRLRCEEIGNIFERAGDLCWAESA